MVGVEGIFGGVVKCIEIGKNINGESILLGWYWYWEMKVRGVNGIRDFSSFSCKWWILGVVWFDLCSVVVNVLSILFGEYVCKNEI